MNPSEFRQHGHALVDWIADYLETVDTLPVLARVEPGAIAAALPASAPDEPEPFSAILADVDRLIVPGLTHWNHPSFFAYFAITASAPGVLADLLASALSQQAMLWRTSPAATELEAVTLGWLRKLIGLPDAFEGVIYDTASISTLHALIAARGAVTDVRAKGLPGRTDVPPVTVYASAESHSSVDKAVIALGFGHDSLRKVPVDAEFRLRPDRLAELIAADRAAGRCPLAVVATVGTTSTTSIDPVPAIADICAREGIWLHVDAAYGGAAAILPSHRRVLSGADRADSLVINPHKWLLTPFDLSAFYCRRMDVLREALALTPEYLRTTEPGAARNLMDTGIQLGRRFRALKLWFVLRAYGANGVRAYVARAILLAQQLAQWVDDHPDFERLAPVPFSVVCFRWAPRDGRRSDAELDRANEAILAAVNASGGAFLSHTRIHGRYALRMAIGHERTTETHVQHAWQLVQDAAPR